jgi:hypothetical protein
MTLSPMEPNVSANSRKVMTVELGTQKKSISGLKSSERASIFSSEDPQMEQINDHQVGLSRGIARGIAHGLISYHQSREMISPFAFSLPGCQETKGCFLPLHFQTSKPEARNVKAPKSHFDISATRSSRDKGGFCPLHFETLKPEARNVKAPKSHFGISATGSSRDKGCFHPLHFQTLKPEA